MAALLVSAAIVLSGCGASAPDPPATTPVTFSITTTTPTSTVPTPTARPYLGPDGLMMETGPFLAPATTTRLGEIVNGIQCERIPQLAYTSYAHLQVYVDGRSRALPGGIGMADEYASPTDHGLLYHAASCMYWLHTRAADGLIEVQSPVSRRFTLGDLFAIWRQPLNSTHVAEAHGRVTATVNGRRWHGDPANIPLTENAAIQLDVGRPVPPPQQVVWVGTAF